MSDLSRIESNPEICSGKAVIRGTRVLVRNILSTMRAGDTREKVLTSYPSLTEEDIDAAFAYAIELVDEVRLITGAA